MLSKNLPCRGAPNLVPRTRSDALPSPEDAVVLDVVDLKRDRLAVTHDAPLAKAAHACAATAPCAPRPRRIVERASELKRLFEKTILLIVHTKRKFDDVGRGGGAHKAMLLHVRKLCAPYLPLK